MNSLKHPNVLSQLECTMRATIYGSLLAGLLLAGCEYRSIPPASAKSAPTPAPAPTPSTPAAAAPDTGKVDQMNLSDAEWKKKLTPEQYRVLREKGTERAFTGKYWNTETPGVYKCAGCGAVLFESGSKFDSGCGWPSFDSMIAAGAVVEHKDTTLGMERTEVVCARCGGHLGHVFDDGPTKTHLRYCINSASIELDAADKPDKK